MAENLKEKSRYISNILMMAMDFDDIDLKVLNAYAAGLTANNANVTEPEMAR